MKKILLRIISVFLAIYTICGIPYIFQHLSNGNISDAIVLTVLLAFWVWIIVRIWRTPKVPPKRISKDITSVQHSVTTNPVYSEKEQTPEQPIDPTPEMVMQKINSQETIAPHSSQISGPIKFNRFKVHPDIKNLIWISKIWDLSLQQEPSAISLSLDIAEPTVPVDNPNYYPEYRNLTPYQRWEYWEFLEDPYNKDAKIGYCFLLLYGLERHLLLGNSKQAAPVIIKLMKAHRDHKSFVAYASDALFIASGLKHNPDYLVNLDDDLLSPQKQLFKYALLNKPISPATIIAQCRKYGFTNKRYIQLYPKLFEQQLTEALIKEYGISGLPIRQYYSKNTPEKITLALSNFSLHKTYDIPNLFSNPNLANDVKRLLQEAHNNVKIAIKNN